MKFYAVVAMIVASWLYVYSRSIAPGRELERITDEDRARLSALIDSLDLDKR